MKMERDILPSGALYIGGDWREGRGAEITSVFPADGTVTRVLRGASTEDGEEAIARARAAQPAWGALKPHERARVLHAIAEGIEANIGRRPDGLAVACLAKATNVQLMNEARDAGLNVITFNCNCTYFCGSNIKSYGQVIVFRVRRHPCSSSLNFRTNCRNYE